MDKEAVKQDLDYEVYYRSEVGDLTGRGDEIKALCPFHADKDPSLCINLKTGVYFCQSCKIGGDVFHFYQKRHGCTFSEAVQGLADFAGVNGRPKKSRGKIVATYDYQDAGGKLVFQVVRLEPKDFYQRRPGDNGKWIDSVKGLGLSLIACRNFSGRTRFSFARERPTVAGWPTWA